MRKVSIGAMALVFAQLPAHAASACSAQSGAQVMPLVELYTSEGCSSCPPADRWFSAHVDDSAANWLAFHVDYWDSIGWPDRFGSAAYSRRQRTRVKAATGGSTVYTPQVMIGTQVQAPWRGDIDATLRQAHAPSLAGLALRLQPGADGWRVALGASRAGKSTTGDPQVWLAQYSDAETTRVRTGENAGVTLHHDRVVRRLWGPWPLGHVALSQQVMLQMPSAHWGVTAFVQDAQGRVWQSLGLPAAQCAAETASAGKADSSQR